MHFKASISMLFIVLFLVGCGTRPATVPAASTTPTVKAGQSQTQSDFIAVADKFSDVLIKQQDYAGAVGLFDDQMKAALPESKLREIWETLPKQVGSFQSRSEARLAERKEPYQRVIVPLQFEKAALNMLVVIDVNTGKISGLFFQPNRTSQ